jgi:hypothetical protein
MMYLIYTLYSLRYAIVCFSVSVQIRRRRRTCFDGFFRATSQSAERAPDVMIVNTIGVVNTSSQNNLLYSEAPYRLSVCRSGALLLSSRAGRASGLRGYLVAT